MTLRGAACQIRQFPIDQVLVPLRHRVKISHSRGGDHLINLFRAQNTSLARRHHLHDVGGRLVAVFANFIPPFGTYDVEFVVGESSLA